MPTARGILQRAIDHPLRFRGDAVECPICQHSFASLALGPGGRVNACCPRCRSLERHRVLWLFLARQTDLLTRRQRVLHFAPERPIGSRLRKVHGDGYVSGDILASAAMAVMDITALPKTDDSFDAVLCSHVLEHVPDDAQGMREIARVLAPGGIAVMQHPIDFGLATTYEDSAISTEAAREAAYHHRDHCRLYGRDFPDRLAAAGLNARHIRIPEVAGPREVERYALADGFDGDYRFADIWLCRSLAARD